MSALKRYVENHPGSIARLARAAGVSHAQMSRIVHRKRGASLRVVGEISRETGIPVAEVIASILLDGRAPEQASA